MISRSRLAVATALVLAGLIVAGAALVIHNSFFRPNTITAFFSTATGIYPGDDVRVSGVKVGTIKSVQPEGTTARLTLNVDRDVPIPADAKAVIVAQNLVSARYVQLTPATRRGPTMRDGAVIPVERTAVPVEWDQVKTQLMRLAMDLGPKSDVSGTAVATIHRQRRQRDERQRRQAAADAGCNCPGWGGSWPTAAATSSTSSRTCRPSSPRCATARSRSCSSRTAWPR